MSFRVFHALWDADDSRVALFLNDNDPAAARWAGRYGVYLTFPGQHGGLREFLGIFDTTLPPPPDWRHLPPWILLPLRKGPLTGFQLELVAQSGGGTLPPLVFDRAVTYDFGRRGAIDEERVYCWHALTASGAAPDSPPFRHLLIDTQEIEGDHAYLKDMIDTFVDTAANPPYRYRITSIMACTVRGGRIGPATEIFGPRARRDLHASSDFESRSFPTLEALRQMAQDADEDTESIDTRAFRHTVVDARAYEQPKLALHLGVSERGAQRLRERVSFLHIPTNSIGALAQARSRTSATGTWVNRILRISDMPEARTPLDLCTIVYGAQLPLRHGRDGFRLEYAFDGVSMGDIVGIFVDDRVRITYVNDAMAATDGTPEDDAFSSLYLRFLIDRLVPMDDAQVLAEYNDVIANVVTRLKRQLAHRHEPGEAPDETRGPAETIRPPRGLGLADMLWPACLATLDGLDRAAPRGHRPLREVMPQQEFARMPHLAHALMATPRFAAAVAEVRGRRPPDGENGIGAAALHMAGGDDRVRDWVRAQTTAEQQATIWDLFEIGPDLAAQLARRNVTIPAAYKPDPATLRAIRNLLQDSSGIARAAAVYRAFGYHDEAHDLTGIGVQLAARGGPAAPGPSLDDLEAMAGRLGHAHELVAADIACMGRILAACGLPVEPIDPAQVPFEPVPPDQHVASLLARIEPLVRRKAAPTAREAARADIEHLRSPALIEELVRRLELVDHTSEILRVTVATAEAITQWANAPADAAIAGGRRMAAPAMTEADWLGLRQALRQPDALPGPLRVDRLAEDDWAHTGVPMARDMAQCAAALRLLVREARAEAETRLGEARTLATRDLDDQFACLETYGGIALATLAAQVLQAEARQLHTRLAGRLPHAEAPEPLRRAWDGLGRALAPDHAIAMLPEALGHAGVLSQAARALIEAAGGGADPGIVLTLPQPPRFADVRPSLPA